MKRLYSKDLGIIFLLTAVYIILISFPNFNEKYVLDIIFFVLFFLFTGYSLIALIRPEEEYKDILRKPVLLLEFSVLFSLAVSVILRFTYLGLHLRTLVMVLSILIMVMSISAYIRRINHYNSRKQKKELRSDQIAEVSKNIKELTKSSVKMEENLEDITETTKQKESRIDTPEKQVQTTKPDKLVVTEEQIMEKSNEQIYEDKKPVEASMPKTGYAKLFIDLIIIDLLSIFILATYFVNQLHIGLINYIVGWLFMVFLVGYTLVKILFPRRNSLSKKIIVGFSIGLSLPITSIIGLVLNSTKYGISIQSMLFPLAVLTIIMSLYAFKRLKDVNR